MIVFYSKFKSGTATDACARSGTRVHACSCTCTVGTVVYPGTGTLSCACRIQIASTFAAVCKPRRPDGSGCKNVKLWFGANNGGYLVRPHLIFVMFSHVSCAFPRQIYPVCYFFSVCLRPVMSITETAERAQLSF